MLPLLLAVVAAIASLVRRGRILAKLVQFICGAAVHVGSGNTYERVSTQDKLRDSIPVGQRSNYKQSKQERCQHPSRLPAVSLKVSTARHCDCAAQSTGDTQPNERDSDSPVQIPSVIGNIFQVSFLIGSITVSPPHLPVTVASRTMADDDLYGDLETSAEVLKIKSVSAYPLILTWPSMRTDTNVCKIVALILLAVR